jgi:glycosyltransferase involved in cell wall biosynthesis
MRVALVGPFHPWRGGIAQYLGLFAEALAVRHQVLGITFTRQYPGFLFPGQSQLDPDAAPPAVPVERLVDSLDPRSWSRAAGRLGEFAPHALIYKWWLPFFAPAFARIAAPLRRRNTRVVLVCDNLVPHERRPLDGALTRWMLRESDGYLVMSESVEADLERLKPGAPRRRVRHPLYTQFDRGRWSRESARAHLGLAGDVLLFFGYVRPYKGLDVLLEALPAVRARRPVTLVVAGEFYEPAAPYRERVARLGLAEAVRFLDRYLPDDEVEALFRAADLVVLPYRSATQSGVTQVAYALGAPVLTTAVGGLPETVRDGETGLVVPSEDPAALAAAAVRFFEEDLSARLRAGVEELRREHSWDALACAFEDLVASLGVEAA